MNFYLSKYLIFFLNKKNQDLFCGIILAHERIFFFIFLIERKYSVVELI